MTGSRRFSVETIREAVRRRLADISLRELAAEIPMSFSGLRSFAAGGNPHPKTRAHLVAWYATSQGDRKRRVPKADVEAAIELLRAYLDEDGREGIRSRRRAEIMRRLA